MLDNLWVV